MELVAVTSISTNYGLIVIMVSTSALQAESLGSIPSQSTNTAG